MAVLQGDPASLGDLVDERAGAPGGDLVFVGGDASGNLHYLLTLLIVTFLGQ